MSDTAIIRTMTRDDVDFAIRQAAKEGWNPGLADAECFYAADPEGFFVAELGGEPVATISAVKYDNDFGFVGLYIVVQDKREKGYGWKLWQHAMHHLDGCTVGLDAVLEQETTYQRAGFQTHYRSARYEGTGGGKRPKEVVRLETVDFAKVVEYDHCCFPGARETFLRTWLEAPGAQGFGVLDGDNLKGFGVIRPCAKGYKIGPLFADDVDVAEQIFQALISVIHGQPYYLDVVEPNKAAMAMVKKHGLKEVFVTVRMYAGPAPKMDMNKIFGVTSFELG